MASKTPMEKFEDQLATLRLMETSDEYAQFSQMSVTRRLKESMHAKDVTRKARIESTWAEKVANAEHVLDMNPDVLRTVMRADSIMAKAKAKAEESGKLEAQAEAQETLLATLTPEQLSDALKVKLGIDTTDVDETTV